MTKCDLCSTEQSHSYSSVYGIGMVCHRCSLLSLAGPEMAMMPHCPKPPPDTDPTVLEAYEKGREPLTISEFDKWVEKSRHDNSGGPMKGRDRVQHDMTTRKLEKWFSNSPKNGCGDDNNEMKLSFQEFENMANSLPIVNAARDGSSSKDNNTKDQINGIKKIIFDLKQQDASTECGGCGCWASSMTCSKCSKQKYCSRVCQRKHWKEHKKTCCTSKADE